MAQGRTFRSELFNAIALFLAIMLPVSSSAHGIVFLGQAASGIDLAVGFKAVLAPNRTELPPLTGSSGQPIGSARLTSAMYASPMVFAPQAQPGPGTLLDEVGRLNRTVLPAEVNRWKAELPKAKGERAMWLRIWLGEYELAREYPEEAKHRFEDVAENTKAGTPLNGLARYNIAISKFYMGRYRDSEDDFAELLKARSPGFEGRNAILFMRRAGGCASVHERNAALGIVQPSELDPMCGVSAVAVIMRDLGRPYDEASLSKIVPHTGMGSSSKDIQQGLKTLGLNSYVVTLAKPEGIRALPLPAVARVEHDHFVVVVSTSDKGVRYHCSDCGPWPGGYQNVTWEQWRAMEADGFVVPSAPGSDEDLAMKALAARAVLHIGIDTLEELGQVVDLSGLTAGAKALVAALLTQVPPAPRPPDLVCGMKPSSLKCPEECDPVEVPYFCALDSAPVTSAGSASGDPVNLATGEEEYKPIPDFNVYNPNGPSVTLRRIYNTFNRQQTGFGYSWSHNFHWGISEPVAAPESGVQMYLMLPNEGRIKVTAPEGPTALNTLVDCTVEAGFPLKIQWRYLGTNTNQFEITYKNRIKMITETFTVVGMDRRLISKVVDRFNNELKLNYQDYPVKYGAHSSKWRWQRRLTSITDTNNNALLTLTVNNTGHYSEITDCYGRTRTYSIGEEPNEATNIDEFYWSLHSVSQFNSSALRFAHTYANEFAGHNRVKFLKTMTVPSPSAGASERTTTLHYATQASGAPVAYITKVVDSNGNRREYDYPEPVAGLWKTTVSVRDSSNALQAQYTVSYNGHLVPFGVWNASNQPVVTYGYTNSAMLHKPTSVTLHYDGTTSRTWTMTYDTFGNMTSMTTPKGTTTTYSWEYPTLEPIGRVTEITEQGKTSTLITYYSSGASEGLVHTVSSPIPGQTNTGNRQTTTYTYTAKGNIATITSPGNNATATHTTTFNYTTDGTFSQTEKFGQPLTVANTNNEKGHFRYDARGNVLKAWDHAGNETAKYYSATYNAEDDVTTSEVPATGNTGTGRTKTVNTYQYVGGPLSMVQLFDEGNTVPAIRTVNYTYGNEGEVTGVSGDTEPSTVTYDALYRARTFDDGMGSTHRTHYDYDLLGNLTKVRLPMYNSTTHFDSVRFTAFDRVGNPLTRIDGRGKTTNYVYGDADGELTEVNYTGNDSTQDVTLTYDNHGRVSTVTDGAGTASSTYDDLDNVLTGTRTYTGISAKTFTYGYYPNGQRSSLATPAGTWNYDYDTVGRPTGMSGPGGPILYNYTSNGWLSSRDHTTASTTYGYNDLGMLTAQESNLIIPNDILELQFSGFKYDGAFNLKEVQQTFQQHTAFSGTNKWTYDTKNRLTRDESTKAGGFDHSFAYDLASNPTTFKGASRTFNAANQRTGTGFVYDGNGNATTHNSTTATYDVENRLASYGSNATFGYRSDNLRAWKQIGSTRTYFLYDGGNAVLEMNSSGTVTAVNCFGPDGLVSRQSGGNWTYYTFDQQGNVAVRQNSDGSISSRSTFDAYGAETATNSPSDPYAYNGQWGYYYDRETGLYYCQNRYYDPSQGRWLNRDPIGYSGGANLYGYCWGGPVNRADSDGQLAFLIVGAIIIAGILTTSVAVAPTSPDDVTPEAYAGYVSDLNAWKCEASLIVGSIAITGAYGGAAAAARELAEEATGAVADSAGIPTGAPSKRKPKKQLIEEYEEVKGPFPYRPDGSGKRQIADHEVPLADGGEDHGRNIIPQPDEQAHIDRHKARGDYKRWGKRRGKKGGVP